MKNINHWKKKMINLNIHAICPNIQKCFNLASLGASLLTINPCKLYILAPAQIGCPTASSCLLVAANISRCSATTNQFNPQEPTCHKWSYPAWKQCFSVPILLTSEKVQREHFLEGWWGRACCFFMRRGIGYSTTVNTSVVPRPKSFFTQK